MHSNYPEIKNTILIREGMKFTLDLRMVLNTYLFEDQSDLRDKKTMYLKKK